MSFSGRFTLAFLREDLLNFGGFDVVHFFVGFWTSQPFDKHLHGFWISFCDDFQLLNRQMMLSLLIVEHSVLLLSADLSLLLREGHYLNVKIHLLITFPLVKSSFPFALHAVTR